MFVASGLKKRNAAFYDIFAIELTLIGDMTILKYLKRLGGTLKGKNGYRFRLQSSTWKETMGL